jgi:hypothetical protein
MSKFMFFDFKCHTCGNEYEGFVKPDVLEEPCIQCGQQATRLISAPRTELPGTDPDFPGAYDAWAKKHEQKRKSDAKFYKEHGVDKKHHSYGS